MHGHGPHWAVASLRDRKKVAFSKVRLGTLFFFSYKMVEPIFPALCHTISAVGSRQPERVRRPMRVTTS